MPETSWSHFTNVLSRGNLPFFTSLGISIHNVKKYTVNCQISWNRASVQFSLCLWKQNSWKKIHQVINNFTAWFNKCTNLNMSILRYGDRRIFKQRHRQKRENDIEITNVMNDLDISYHKLQAYVWPKLIFNNQWNHFQLIYQNNVKNRQRGHFWVKQHVVPTYNIRNVCYSIE